MIEKSSPEFAKILGQAIVAMSYSMCGVDSSTPVPHGGVVNGYDKLAPAYVEVTEHRDGPGPEQWKDYSSCGDQLHAILERVGVRLPALNRASQKQYVSGANITRLQQFPFSKPAPKDPGFRPQPGTLCLIWNTGYDAHALVCLGPGSDENHMLTGNYGASGMSSSSGPGANVADSPWVNELSLVAPHAPTGYQLVGGSRRKLHYIITPESIVPYIDAQINLSGIRGFSSIEISDIGDKLGARYE